MSRDTGMRMRLAHMTLMAAILVYLPLTTTPQGMSAGLSQVATHGGPAAGVPGAAAPEETATAVPLPSMTATGAPRQLLAAVHVHSTASSGARSLPELARLAIRSGLDVVVLAENLGYEFRYAPAGLRLFGEARLAMQTLEQHGIERFVDEVDQVRRAEPDLLLLSGVEVPPYYYWTGSLLRGDLTLHDTQRNVLVVPSPNRGATPHRTAEFFQGIPAVGNRYQRRYGIGSLALLVPGLLCVALALRTLTRGGASGRRRRRTAMAVALLLPGGLLLYANFPFSTPSLQPYDPELRYQAAENLLAYVQRNGGLSFWSMPEAVDYHERNVGPLTVRLSTDPYADVLSEAPGHTGFGGVYADTVTMWEAGREWDDTLGAFQAGLRATAPWIIGESAFHYSGQANKELADILTVLLVDEASEDAAFAALAVGRSYALRRSDGAPDLRLAEFSVTPHAAGTRAFTATSAGSGQTLTVAATGSVEVEVVVRVEDVAGSQAPLQVDVVRNGRLHRRIEATTPFEGRWLETVDAGEDSVYFRVTVRATRAAYLVSNPVFLQRRP